MRFRPREEKSQIEVAIQNYFVADFGIVFVSDGSPSPNTDPTDSGAVAECALDFRSALFTRRRTHRFRPNRTGERHESRAPHLAAGSEDEATPAIQFFGEERRFAALVSGWETTRIFIQP